MNCKVGSVTNNVHRTRNERTQRIKIYAGQECASRFPKNGQQVSESCKENTSVDSSIALRAYGILYDYSNETETID